MSGQREWLKIWARTVGMPIGKTDEDKPRFMPIKQKNVKNQIVKLKKKLDQVNSPLSLKMI